MHRAYLSLKKCDPSDKSILKLLIKSRNILSTLKCAAYYEHFKSKNCPKIFRNIEVSAITKHRSAVVAVLSAKSSFSAKTVSVKPSF